MPRDRDEYIFTCFMCGCLGAILGIAAMGIAQLWFI
jgi:hypothetical protein